MDFFKCFFPIYIQPCSFSPPYKVLLQGGRSSSSLSSSSPLDNSFVHFLYLTTLLYSFSPPFHATSQNAQSLASYYFVLIMAAVAVPRLLVNGNRTGAVLRPQKYIQVIPPVVIDLSYCQPPGLRGAKARKPAREELEFKRKHGYVDNILHVSYAETSVHTVG